MKTPTSKSWPQRLLREFKKKLMVTLQELGPDEKETCITFAGYRQVRNLSSKF